MPWWWRCLRRLETEGRKKKGKSTKVERVACSFCPSDSTTVPVRKWPCCSSLTGDCYLAVPHIELTHQIKTGSSMPWNGLLVTQTKPIHKIPAIWTKIACTRATFLHYHTVAERGNMVQCRVDSAEFVKKLAGQHHWPCWWNIKALKSLIPFAVVVSRLFFCLLLYLMQIFFYRDINADLCHQVMMSVALSWKCT